MLRRLALAGVAALLVGSASEGLATVTPSVRGPATLAYVGHHDTEGASHAFEQARLVLGLVDVRLQPRDGWELAELDAALRHIDEASPQVKQQILEAAVACITADHAVTVEEAELLRAVSASIGCPMPPIMID